MIGSSAYDSHTDSVPLIPAGVAINDIDSVTSVQVVDRAFSVDPPDLMSDCQNEFMGHAASR